MPVWGRGTYRTIPSWIGRALHCLCAVGHITHSHFTVHGGRRHGEEVDCSLHFNGQVAIWVHTATRRHCNQTQNDINSDCKNLRTEYMYTYMHVIMTIRIYV